MRWHISKNNSWAIFELRHPAQNFLNRSYRVDFFFVFIFFWGFLFSCSTIGTTFITIVIPRNLVAVTKFHSSHVMNSGELQHCNWNCNCYLIIPRAFIPGILSSLYQKGCFFQRFVLSVPKRVFFQGCCPLCTQKCCFSKDFARPAPKTAVSPLWY